MRLQTEEHRSHLKRSTSCNKAHIFDRAAYGRSREIVLKRSMSALSLDQEGSSFLDRSLLKRPSASVLLTTATIHAESRRGYQARKNNPDLSNGATARGQSTAHLRNIQKLSGRNRGMLMHRRDIPTLPCSGHHQSGQPGISRVQIRSSELKNANTEFKLSNKNI